MQNTKYGNYIKLNENGIFRSDQMKLILGLLAINRTPERRAKSHLTSAQQKKKKNK